MTQHSPDDRVTHQPRYHASEENADADFTRKPMTARQRWTRVLVIAVVIAVFLAIVILHITGVLGKGTNG